MDQSKETLNQIGNSISDHSYKEMKGNYPSKAIARAHCTLTDSKGVSHIQNYWLTNGDNYQRGRDVRDMQGNGPIRLYEFKDRIELVNPGGLYGNARPENFPFINDYRNPIVVAAFKTLGYVNMFNRGVREVQRQLDENGNPPAIFNVDRLTAFEVIIYSSANLKGVKSEGTSRVTSQGTSQDMLNQSVSSQNNLHCTMSANSKGTSQGVPSRGVPSQGGGLEIVTKGILRFCSQPKTLKEIAEYLGIKAFKRVKTRYLDYMIAQGVLTMTIPDKPTSRFQKYVAIGKTNRNK